MKTIKSILAAVVVGLSISGFSSGSAAETGASEHSALASKHSALASSHAVSATTKVASAVVAVPLISAGTVSTVAGDALVSSGKAVITNSDKCDTPLVVTRKVITVDPSPDKVIVNVH